MAELANAWLRLGHRVTFFVPQYSGDPYFPTQAEIKWLDERGRITERLEPSRRPRQARLLGSWATLTRALDRYGTAYDIVLANQHSTAWPVFLSRIPAKKFYYVQAYEPQHAISASSALTGKLIWAAATSTYFLPLKRIVNSPIYYKYKALRARALVPPGVDFAIFHPEDTSKDIGKNSSAKEAWQGRTVILGCIGRKEVYKGTGYVLDAFEMLKRRGVDVELRVAFGNLPDARPIPAGCHVVMPHSDRELAAFYRSLDIMIAPGTAQLGAPHYPVMEPMACGTPVITTGYMPASADNAWLVPTHDAEAIADAVQEVMSSPELRAERQRRALEAIRPFSWENVSRQMLEIFTDSSG